MWKAREKHVRIQHQVGVWWGSTVKHRAVRSTLPRRGVQLLQRWPHPIDQGRIPTTTDHDMHESFREGLQRVRRDHRRNHSKLLQDERIASKARAARPITHPSTAITDPLNVACIHSHHIWKRSLRNSQSAALSSEGAPVTLTCTGIPQVFKPLKSRRCFIAQPHAQARFGKALALPLDLLLERLLKFDKDCSFLVARIGALHECAIDAHRIARIEEIFCQIWEGADAGTRRLGGGVAKVIGKNRELGLLPNAFPSLHRTDARRIVFAELLYRRALPALQSPSMAVFVLNLVI